MKKNSKILRIIAVVMLSLLIAIPLASCGKGQTVAPDASGKSHGISWDYKQNNQTLTIYKNNSGEGNPDFANEKSVPWSSVASSVQKVVVENGVEGVGDYWFYGMSKLASVTLHESVTYIGKSAFAFCSSLGQIGDDGKLPSNVKAIRDRAFEASGLTRIDIAKATEVVGNHAFVYCNKLSNVVVRSEKIASFDASVFSYCNALAEINMAAEVDDEYAIVVKDGAAPVKPARFFEQTLDHTKWEYKFSVQDGKKIGTLKITGSGTMDDIAAGEAWKGLAAIKEADSVVVRISSEVSSISKYAFEGMTNITEVVLEKIADNRSATTIYEGAFKGCTGLTAFYMDKSITDIKASAFEGSGLVSLDLSKDIKDIGDRAFADCKALKAVVIRSSIPEEIGAECFEGCAALNEFYVVDKKLCDDFKAEYGEKKVKNVGSDFKDYTTYQEPVTEEEKAESGTATPPAPTPNAENKNDNGKKGSKIALIIMGVLVVGIIVAIVLFKRYDKKTSGNNTTVVKNKNGQEAKNAKKTNNGKKGKK